MQLNKQHLKPYLFILLFLLVPMAIFQIIKSVTNNDNIIVNPTEIHDHLPEQNIIVDSVFAIAIHGGAGNITQESLTPELEAAYRAKLFEALHVGMSRLKKNDSAIYIVEAVIKILENSPLFNAGKGAVFTHNGKNELDASIMDGRNMNAGAVAGARSIKNPISAALAVMQKSKHVLLSGTGADLFASENGLETVDQSYFYTEKRWKALQKAKHKTVDEKYGTVGCVVLDKHGNLAAGTSTGGMTNKKYGRIGDAPIIGAGTFADNKSCAVSSTGHGEYFIRYNVAADIAARMKYGNLNLQKASKLVISELKQNGGFGGVICVDRSGTISMEFNTNAMFRASFVKGNELKVRIFNTQTE